MQVLSISASMTAPGGGPQYVRSLFVTLRRGMAGRPHFHKAVLTSLGLRTRHQCVERPNNSSIRGMLAKVGAAGRAGACMLRARGACTDGGLRACVRRSHGQR